MSEAPAWRAVFWTRCVLTWMTAIVFGLMSSALMAQDIARTPATTAADNASGRFDISLLTIGPGEIFFERFGHNALVVRDRASGQAVAYNYGIFDFNEGEFFVNFARGRMTYRIAADELGDDLAMYRDEHRSITEQRLNLSAAQADALVAYLAWNSRPENAHYRYDYFTANCSTRVRDALDHALGGALLAQSHGRSRGFTYRLDALRLMAPEPALMLLIDLGLGPFADQRIDFWQESFVPETFSNVVAQASTTGVDGRPVPLQIDARVIEAGDVAAAPVLPPDLRWPFLLGGIAFAAILFVLGQSQRTSARIALGSFATVFSLFCGLGGCVLLFLWFGSDHRAAWRNENLLLLNPLSLLLIPAWLMSLRTRWNASRWSRGIAWLVVACAAFALFSKILPWFVQANLAWIFLFLPIHIALALTLSRRRRGSGLAPSSSLDVRHRLR